MPKTFSVKTYLTETEKSKIIRRANELGLAISDYLRTLVLADTQDSRPYHEPSKMDITALMNKVTPVTPFANIPSGKTADATAKDTQEILDMLQGEDGDKNI
jgi:hypothetical protein